MTGLGGFLAEVFARRGAAVSFDFGQVTAVSPLTITMAGSTTPVPGVEKVKSYTPVLNDVVFYAHIDEAAVLVLGAVG